MKKEDLQHFLDTMDFIAESQHRDKLVQEGKIKPVSPWDFIALKNRDADKAEKQRRKHRLKQTDLDFDK